MGLLAVVAAGALAALVGSAWLLSITSRPRTRGLRVRWWLAGVLVPSILTFGSTVVAGQNDSIADSIVVGTGFLTALIVLLVGAAYTPDAAAWWLGNAVPAVVWAYLVLLLILAFRSLGD